MNHNTVNGYIKRLVILYTVLALTISAFVPAFAAEESSPQESSGFLTRVKGYDESVEKELLSHEDAVQAYPYYDTDFSKMKWMVVLSNKKYVDTYVLIGKAGLGSHERVWRSESDLSIDFDKAESEFASLGDVSDVYIESSSYIKANLVFGTVNGKEYVVPFTYSLNGGWDQFYETGTIYPAEEIRSLVEQRKKGPEIHEPITGVIIEQIHTFVANLGIVPLAILVGVVMVVVIILIIRTRKDIDELEE